jgi:hypothetical protein
MTIIDVYFSLHEADERSIYLTTRTMPAHRCLYKVQRIICVTLQTAESAPFHWKRRIDYSVSHQLMKHS